MAQLRPVITGLGLVTPLGADVESTWGRLLAGEYIRTHSTALLDQRDEIPRVNQLAREAARQAIRQARWGLSSVGRETGIVVGTSKGDVASWIENISRNTGFQPVLGTSHGQDARVTGTNIGSSCLGLSDVAWDLATHLNMPSAPRLTISAACASGLQALIRASLMISSGQAKRVLVVAAESSVHPLFLASFKRLGILPEEALGCRPFDQRRGGFFMSEAAAAVCLETPGADEHSSPPIAAVEKFALGSDAVHITLSDPHAATLRRMLKELVAGQVDLIHAHGTGTQANDPVELAAIDELMTGDPSPILYSHKAALGHSLGAAGLVAVVINCLAHERGVIPGNVRTQSPLTTRNVCLPRETTQRQLRRSLALASGFGGPAAAVALVKA